MHKDHADQGTFDTLAINFGLFALLSEWCVIKIFMVGRGERGREGGGWGGGLQ